MCVFQHMPLFCILQDRAEARTHMRIGIIPSTRNRPFLNADLHCLVKRRSATTKMLQETLTSCIEAVCVARRELTRIYPRTAGLPSEQTCVPRYLNDIPKFVLTVFRENSWRLSSTCQGFRDLVKQYCRLPAYFGVVLFKRIKQYKSVIQQLCQEKVLEFREAPWIPEDEDENSEPPNSSENDRIGLRDFLRFCTDDFCSANAREKFLKLIHEPQKDEILSLETSQGHEIYQCSKIAEEWKWERIDRRHLKPFIEALIDRHPDLASLRKQPTKRKAYIKYVLVSILSSLEGVSTKFTTLHKLSQSNVVDIFYQCAVNRLSQLPAFNVVRFETIYGTFCNALVSEKAGEWSQQSIITKDSLTLVENLDLHPRILDTVLPLTGNGAGFEKFLLFFFAHEDAMSVHSIGYWFRILDFDDDGYLSRSDLEWVYRQKLMQSNIMISQEIIDKTMLVTLDMVKPKWVSCTGDFRISLMDIRRTGCGYLLYDVFIRSSVSDVELRVHEYANFQREHRLNGAFIDGLLGRYD
eukprot:gb/GECG01006683.1/.p1 GENE.gb/GECG01006683.1/~~gb/GECG01006683.1/.p1  ORF type:complete len:524 (+),score=43.56 gb/GECG01006683.1/:1-1572(+)